MTGERLAIPARRIGRHAYEYLAGHERFGSVVGSFHQGLTLIFDEDGNSAFVTLQTPEVPLHPWAVEVGAIPRNVELRDPASAGESSLCLRDWQYSWDRTYMRRLEVDPYTTEEAARAQSSLPMLSGILESERATRPTPPFQDAIDELLTAWMKDRNVGTLAPLAGLGSGSTPAGDDVLVGILAAHSALWHVVPAARKQLEHLWMLIGGIVTAGVTFRPSAQMLQASADGAFAEPIHDLVHRLASAKTTEEELASATHQLLAQGATSGLSTLQGLVTAFGVCDVVGNGKPASQPPPSGTRPNATQPFPPPYEVL